MAGKSPWPPSNHKPKTHYETSADYLAHPPDPGSGAGSSRPALDFLPPVLPAEFKEPIHTTQSRKLNMKWKNLLSILLLAHGQMLMGQTNSSVAGHWDCTLSGARQGVAYLTFADGSPGGGLSLTEVVVPRLPSSPRPILINGDYPSNGLGLRT